MGDPGQTNSWHFEALGTEGGVRYNTRDANTIYIYEKEKDGWTRINLGHAVAFPVITGGIFQTGFPDLNLQMWAAYAAERAGELNKRFDCATIDEAVQSHELFAAALKSHAEKTVASLES